MKNEEQKIIILPTYQEKKIGNKYFKEERNIPNLQQYMQLGNNRKQSKHYRLLLNTEFEKSGYVLKESPFETIPIF